MPHARESLAGVTKYLLMEQGEWSVRLSIVDGDERVAVYIPRKVNGLAVIRFAEMVARSTELKLVRR